MKTANRGTEADGGWGLGWPHVHHWWKETRDNLYHSEKRILSDLAILLGNLNSHMCEMIFPIQGVHF